ncbi:MAG: CDP-diacylglycerol/glycerol-3-phosphate 3-phosphatidyltransferase [Thermoleophilia bacterium]|nr:CDP-diacylglycerol/glycerol-3-phosphate 3-phosphatidyltransferase [Thermoleophilia bacterium]
MESPRSTFIRNLPNVLTSLRLAAVPIFIVLMVVEEGPSVVAGALFFGAAFTDFFDGFLARRFHVMSQFGKVVDPLADRLLVNSAVLLLCFYDSRWSGGGGRLMGPEFLIVFARDLPAIYGYSKVREFTMVDVTQLGKWGMALMMAGITWLLLLPDATWPVWPFEAGLIVSVVVFVQYFRRYGWMLRRSTARNPEAVVERAPDARVD